MINLKKAQKRLIAEMSNFLVIDRKSDKLVAVKDCISYDFRVHPDKNLCGFVKGNVNWGQDTNVLLHYTNDVKTLIEKCLSTEGITLAWGGIRLSKKNFNKCFEQISETYSLR